MLQKTPESEGGNWAKLLQRVRKALDTAQEIAIPVTQMEPYPDQPRTYFEEGAIKRLSEAIRTGGQTTSGIVRQKRKDRYEIIDGERRWRAISLIPEEVRPLYKARLIQASDDVVRFIVSGMANFNRQEHTPLEVSDTIVRMHDEFKLPIKEVAALLGISDYWAYSMHGLSKLHPDVRALLDPTLPRKERLATSAAIEIAKLNSSLQLELAQRVIRRAVSITGLRQEVMTIATSAGVPVRTRRTSVAENWDGFCTKVIASGRFLETAESNLAFHGLHMAAKADLAKSLEMIERLKRSQKMLSDMTRVLEGYINVKK